MAIRGRELTDNERQVLKDLVRRNGVGSVCATVGIRSVQTIYRALAGGRIMDSTSAALRALSERLDAVAAADGEGNDR